MSDSICPQCRGFNFVDRTKDGELKPTLRKCMVCGQQWEINKESHEYVEAAMWDEELKKKFFEGIKTRPTDAPTLEAIVAGIEEAIKLIPPKQEEYCVVVREFFGRHQILKLKWESIRLALQIEKAMGSLGKFEPIMPHKDKESDE